MFLQGRGTEFGHKHIEVSCIALIKAPLYEVMEYATPDGEDFFKGIAIFDGHILFDSRDGFRFMIFRARTDVSLWVVSLATAESTDEGPLSCRYFFTFEAYA